VTKPEAALRTVKVHEKAFRDAGLETTFARAIGAVVQPGVEFASTEVIPYKSERAVHLANALANLPGFVFEAHSTLTINQLPVLMRWSETGSQSSRWDPG
jgi:tagatose-1,6-bisphosphate aldolase non-catalytic subunit AgaZ/GatZ